MTSPVPHLDYPATVRRPDWLQLPIAVRAAVGEAAGSDVIGADPPPGSGFTGSFAAVVHLRDGRRAFAPRAIRTRSLTHMAVSWRGLAEVALRVARAASRPAPSRGRRPAARPGRPTTGGYPGDFTGRGRLDYSPDPDGAPDPGEVVWTWVPYEEDHTRGKDRPVLLVGRDHTWLLALMLSSQDHRGPGSDEDDERRRGRTWVELGVGPWDRQGRASQVRTDRVVRVDPAAVRREGAVLDRDRFAQVEQALRAHHGWT